MILYFEHISKMLNKKVYITLIVFAIFLSGCSSNQKKYLQQLPDVPENWSTGSSSSRLLKCRMNEQIVAIIDEISMLETELERK